MAQLFVHDLSGDTFDKAVLDAVCLAGEAVGDTRDPIIRWTRGRDIDGNRSTFGFLELTSIATCGALAKACEVDHLGMKIVPDTLIRSQCLAAANVFEANSIALVSSDINNDDNYSIEDAENGIQNLSLLEKLRQDIKEVLIQNKGKEEENDQENQRNSMEARIARAIRLEPRPHDISDELWEDLRIFRRNQAITEIENDDRRRQRIEEILKQKKQECMIETEEMTSNVDLTNKETERGYEINDNFDPEINSRYKTDVPPSDPVMNDPKEANVLDVVFKKKTKQRSTTALAQGEEGGQSDEETIAKKRKLVPIIFTEEEKKAEMTVEQRLDELSNRAKAFKHREAWEIISEHVERNFGEPDKSVIDMVYRVVKDDLPTISVEKLSEQVRPLLADDAELFSKALLADIRKKIL